MIWFSIFNEVFCCCGWSQCPNDYYHYHIEKFLTGISLQSVNSHFENSNFSLIISPFKRYLIETYKLQTCKKKKNGIHWSILKYQTWLFCMLNNWPLILPLKPTNHKFKPSRIIRLKPVPFQAKLNHRKAISLSPSCVTVCFFFQFKRD